GLTCLFCPNRGQIEDREVDAEAQCVVLKIWSQSVEPAHPGAVDTRAAASRVRRSLGQKLRIIRLIQYIKLRFRLFNDRRLFQCDRMRGTVEWGCRWSWWQLKQFRSGEADLMRIDANKLRQNGAGDLGRLLRS